MRDRGKDLNVEMDKAAESSTVKSVSRRSGTGKPVYSSPAKNLRAAAAAKAELSHLTGDAWRKQAERVNELVDICNKQNEAYRRANPDSGCGGSPRAPRWTRSAYRSPRAQRGGDDDRI